MYISSLTDPKFSPDLLIYVLLLLLYRQRNRTSAIKKGVFSTLYAPPSLSPLPFVLYYPSAVHFLILFLRTKGDEFESSDVIPEMGRGDNEVIVLPRLRSCLASHFPLLFAFVAYFYYFVNSKCGDTCFY